MEKAETGAVGRALAMLGYGTQFAQEELDERDRIVDAPSPMVESRNPPPARQGPAAGAEQARDTDTSNSAGEVLGAEGAASLERERLMAGISDDRWADMVWRYLKTGPDGLEAAPRCIAGHDVNDAMRAVIGKNSFVSVGVAEQGR